MANFRRRSTICAPLVLAGTPAPRRQTWLTLCYPHGSKSGYTFVYTAGTSNQSYSITATPVITSSGQNRYYTDQSGVIRVDTSGASASSASTPIGNT